MQRRIDLVPDHVRWGRVGMMLVGGGHGSAYPTQLDVNLGICRRSPFGPYTWSGSAFRRTGGGNHQVVANDADTDPTVTFYEDGPLLLRGDFVLRTPQGEQIAVDRRAVALCRCGKSGIKPFCDGTHKLIGFRASSHVETGWAESTAAPDNTAAAPENTMTT